MFIFGLFLFSAVCMIGNMRVEKDSSIDLTPSSTALCLNIEDPHSDLLAECGKSPPCTDLAMAKSDIRVSEVTQTNYYVYTHAHIAHMMNTII